MMIYQSHIIPVPFCNVDVNENHLSETSSPMFGDEFSVWLVFKVQQGNCSILITILSLSSIRS